MSFCCRGPLEFCWARKFGKARVVFVVVLTESIPLAQRHWEVAVDVLEVECVQQVSPLASLR